MSDSGNYRTSTLQGWQRTNVVSAANCLREQMARTPDDQKLRAAYEGLLDLLDPSRLLARKQRELADAARQPAPSIRNERRVAERRKAALDPPAARERRRSDRRDKERRSR